MKKLMLCIMMLMLLGLGSQAYAALFDGQTINYQYYFPDSSSLYTSADNGDKVVGSGVEVLNSINNHGTIDISDTNIFAEFSPVTGNWFFLGASFNGFRITDVNGTIPDFTSVTIDPITNMVGFDLSRIAFDADHIWVNWQGLEFNSQTIVSLNVRDHQVPDPATMLLFGAGLAGLGIMRKRFKA